MNTVLAIGICIFVFPPLLSGADSRAKERRCPKGGGELTTAGVIALDGNNGDYCDFWTDGASAFQTSAANNF